VTVKVQDNGSPPLSTNCFLNVAVEDENDNAPTFDYTNEFYETNMLRTVAANSRVYRVFAMDADAGDNGRVSYRLSASVPGCSGCFRINASSGWITRGAGALQQAAEVCRCQLAIVNLCSDKPSAELRMGGGRGAPYSLPPSCPPVVVRKIMCPFDPSRPLSQRKFYVKIHEMC